MTRINDFNEVLNSRKSVKVFDENYKIPREEMDEIITKATKAPSSVNMQPWRIAVVESDEMKEKVKESFGFNSRQLTTSSANYFWRFTKLRKSWTDLWRCCRTTIDDRRYQSTAIRLDITLL